MRKIVVSERLPEAGMEKLRGCAEKLGFSVLFCGSTAEALSAVRDAEIIYGNSPALMKEAGKLKWMCSMTAGVNHYLLPGVLPEHVILSNSSGSYGVSIAEHLVMMVLMLLRRMPEYLSEMARKEWQNGKVLHSILGSSITVVGTGDIGASFAARARAFLPEKITGINRSGANPDGLFDEIGSLSDLDRFLPETGILVLCVPETRETIRLLSRERLALLPPSAIVVNVGRGSAIDQQALVEALNAERLAGAALDVMEQEPIPADDPVWNARNIILTPHMSGQWTLEYTILKSVDMFCEDLENYSAGRPLKYRVDMEAGY